MPNQWYIKKLKNSEPTGPFSDRELVELAAANTISPESMVAAREPAKWFPAARVSKLFELALQRRSHIASSKETIRKGDNAPAVKSTDIVEVFKRISENEQRATEIEKVVNGIARSLHQTTSHSTELEMLKQSLGDLTNRVQESEARLVQQDAAVSEMTATIHGQSDLIKSLSDAMTAQQKQAQAAFAHLAKERQELKQSVDENAQAIELLIQRQLEFSIAIDQLTDSIESQFTMRMSQVADQFQSVGKHWEKLQLEFVLLGKRISETESECFALREQIATARNHDGSGLANVDNAEVPALACTSQPTKFREPSSISVMYENDSANKSIEMKALLSDAPAQSLELVASENADSSTEVEHSAIEIKRLGVNENGKAVMPIESKVLSEELPSPVEETPAFGDIGSIKVETAIVVGHGESAALFNDAASESFDMTAEVTHTVRGTEETCQDGIIEPVVSSSSDSLCDDNWRSLETTVSTIEAPAISSSTDELQLLHRKLQGHFSRLFEKRKSTGFAVYMLEHELEREQVDATVSLVADGLQRFSLAHASWWWSVRYLPLLVVAVEEGYVYEGNGTDYWPRLQRRLNYLFDHDSRRQISAFFERVSRECGIAASPNTPWHHKYCHIAWPITNAVLPLDMRIPFSQTLRLLRVPIQSIDDASLMRFFRQTTVESGSLRYSNWLENKSIPAHLARFVLQEGYDAEFLTTSTLRRLRNDLLAEANARLAILDAIGKQGKKASSGILPSGSRANPPCADINTDQKLRCSLSLRRLEGANFQLEVVLPCPPHSIRAWLQHQIRSRNWEPKQWGNPSAPTIGISSLLFGSPCPVNVRCMLKRKQGDSFLTGWQSLEPDDDTVDWLRRVDVSPSLPIIFRPDEELQFASEHRANFVNAGQVLWVLSDAAVVLPSGVIWLGEISGASVLQVDPSVEQAANWLKSLGVKTGSVVQWRCSHDPSHDRMGLRTCLLGDFLAYELAALNEELNVQIRLTLPDGTQSTLAIDHEGIFGWRIAVPGAYDFSLWAGGQLLDRRTFKAESVPLQADPIFQIQLLGGEATVTSLMQSQLKLEILARRDIQQIEVSIRLGEAKLRMLAPEFPLRIGTTDEIWQKLLTDQNRKAAASGADLSLSVDIAGIESRRWTLENEVADVTWEIQDDSRPIATTDDQALEVVQLTLDSIPPTPASDLGSASIFVVKQHERLCFEMGTIIHSPRTSRLPKIPRSPERLERRMVASQTKFMALQELIELYIALLTSRASHGVAALHQENYKRALRNCISELILGKRWISRQTQQEAEFSVPLVVLVNCAVSRKAGFNSDFHPVASVTPELRHAAMSEMTTAIPPHWWMLTSNHFTDDHAARLDRAVGMAYRQLSSHVEDPIIKELWENADPFTDTATWQLVLHEAIKKLRGEFLAEMVLPAKMGEAILNENLSGMNTTEVAELLVVWTKQYLSLHWSRSLWTGELLGLALLLFERPQSLRRSDWTIVADLLLKDRFMARAIAFTAWRRLQLEVLGD